MLNDRLHRTWQDGCIVPISSVWSLHILSVFAWRFHSGFTTLLSQLRWSLSQHYDEPSTVFPCPIPSACWGQSQLLSHRSLWQMIEPLTLQFIHTVQLHSFHSIILCRMSIVTVVSSIDMFNMLWYKWCLSIAKHQNAITYWQRRCYHAK